MIYPRMYARRFIKGDGKDVLRCLHGYRRLNLLACIIIYDFY